MQNKSIIGVASAAAAAFLAVSPLSAAECVWAGASGSWGSTSGWQNGAKPSAAGDTVVIKGDNVTVTVGDSDIANFELVTEITIEGTGSQLIVDTSSSVNTPAVFSGKGALVKTGASQMNLTTPGSGYRTLLGNLSGGIIVSNGTVWTWKSRHDSPHPQAHLLQVRSWRVAILRGDRPADRPRWAQAYVRDHVAP